MAINFPDSPSTNDTHTVGDKTWTWNGTYWHLNQNSSTYYAQDGVPSNPDGGDFWFESDTGQLFVRYDSAWVEIGHATDFGSSMSDADGDTLIQLEEGSDEDIIRFDTGGTERMTIAAGGVVTMTGDLSVDGGDLTVGNSGDAILSRQSGANSDFIVRNTGTGSVVIRPEDNSSYDAVFTDGNLVLSGDLTVNGTTTTVNSTTLTVDDKNIELGSVASPSDTTADGGGITLKGASDKTILWTNSTDTWDFNQGISVTGTATATAFAGPLTGNVTGNASGTAATVTGAAQTAITSVGTLTSATISGDLTVGTSNAQILGPASGSATAGAVSYSFAGDTDTGFFRWNTNTFSAATNGVNRMTWAADGNVGIGTNSPTNLLHLAGTDPILRIDETAGDDNVKLQLMQASSETEGIELRYESGTGHSYLKSIYSGGNMYFQTAGANTRMQIAAGGKMVLSMGGDYTPAANIGVQSANGQAHPYGHIVSHSHSTILWGTDNNGHYLGGDTKNFKFKRSCTWNAHPGSAGYVAMEIKAGATTHTSTGDADAEYGAIGFAAAGIYIDRHWMGNPGITICNSNVNSSVVASQGTFRMHGSNHTYNSYPATGSDPNGAGDFGISVVCDGTFSPTSDRRRKTDIEDITGALAAVNALQGRTYRFMNSDLVAEDPGSIGGKLYGLIAQEAWDFLPHAIWDDGEEPLENGWCRAMRMDYGAVTAVLVEAIKELSAKVEALENA